jgi:hypothetical protein
MAAPQTLNTSNPQRVRARALAEAPPATMIHARRSAGPVTVDEAGSLYGRLVPWEVTARVSDDGVNSYTERFARGGLTASGSDVIPVYDGHRYNGAGILERGPLIGRLDDVEAREDGLYGRVVLADIPEAARLRALARTVGATFSVEFDAPTAPPGAEIVRTGARLESLAVMTLPHRGAFAGAEVLAVRAAPTDPPEDEEDPPAEGDPLVEDDEEARTEVEGDATPVAARAALRREVQRLMGRGLARPTAHPLARFSGAYELYEAARASQSDEIPVLFRDAYRAYRERVTLARAFVDQITPDNPGVMPPGWLTEIFGILDTGRPVISAIGTRPLPPQGMEVDWPYYDGDMHALVGEQVTEKADVTSVKVSFKKASVPIKTYAGGSDISWQLIRRSQPSYRDSYLRILNIAYGIVTDNVVGDALPLVPGAQSVDYDVAAPDPDGAALKAAVFQASSLVQIATGSPASWVLAATDVFQAFGAMPAMAATPYGTQNVPGTATASTLDVNVSGLKVTHAPDLAPGTAIVSNNLACAWMEDGPFVVAAPVVPKLGEDVAIWGMGAFAAFIPKGIVLLANALPLADQASAGTRKK